MTFAAARRVLAGGVFGYDGPSNGLAATSRDSVSPAATASGDTQAHRYAWRKCPGQVPCRRGCARCCAVRPARWRRALAPASLANLDFLRSWAELLRRTFGINILCCPVCQSTMVLLALITEQDVIAKILTHVKVPREPVQNDDAPTLTT